MSDTFDEKGSSLCQRPYGERICPIMSRPHRTKPPHFIMCQGPDCMCFKWGPATAYYDGRTVDLPYGGPEHGWCSLGTPNRSG